jgi:hypothetical protein
MGRVVKRNKKVANGETCLVEEYVGAYTLELDEREVIIRFDMTNPNAIIYCSDKATNTKFKKLKGIKVIEEDKYGTTYEISKSEIRIGTPKRVRKTADK